MDIITFIPQRIEDLKQKKRITAYALAAKAGINQSALSNIQKKGTLPTLETLQKICNGLGVTMSQFFADEYDRPVLTEYQIRFLNNLDSIPESGREKVDLYLQGLVDAYNDNDKDKKK